MFTSCDSFNFLRKDDHLNSQESTTTTSALTLNTSIQFMFSVRVERLAPLCDNVHSSSDQAAENGTDKRKVLLTTPYEVWLTKLRPRPWPWFEFTPETIQPRLDLVSLSGHCRKTCVVFEQCFCSQLYLRIEHLRLMCDELPNTPGMVSLEFTVFAIYLALLLLASTDISHTRFSRSSTTVTNLKLQLIAFSDESLHVGLLLHKTHGQQHMSNLQAGGDEWKLLKPNFVQANFVPYSDAFLTGNQFMMVVELLLHPVGQISDMVQRWRSQYHTRESNKITYNYGICVGILVVRSGLIPIELELLIPQPGEHLALLQPKPPWSPLVSPQFSTECSSNMRTNSEFLQLTGALWELTQSWTFTDHCSTLSSYWWCFSWGPDAGLTTALFWLAHNSTRKLQEMPCISGSSSTCARLHAMRSITEDYPIAFIMWQFIQSVEHATSCEQWGPGGLHFAELEENEHRLGGKPVVKEEGMSATQIRPQLRRSVGSPNCCHDRRSNKPTK